MSIDRASIPSNPPALESGEAEYEDPKLGTQYYTTEEMGFWIPIPTVKQLCLITNQYYTAKDIARRLCIPKIACFRRQDGEIYDFLLGGWRR